MDSFRILNFGFEYFVYFGLRASDFKFGFISNLFGERN
jgi:hypothetical protein